MRGWVSIAILVMMAGIAPAHADQDPFGPGYKPPPVAKRRPPPPEIKNPGYLVVYSVPFARIQIDGKDTGKMTPIAPRARIALAPGKHKLTFVVTSTGEIFHFTITIKAGETLKVVKDLPVAVTE